MKTLTVYKILNYLFFQVGWLACVWGAAKGFPWMGLVALVPAVLVHLRWACDASVEIRLLMICALTGIVFDALLLATGWVAFPNGNWIPGLAPYWMMILWIFLGTTLNLSMSWMKASLPAAAVLGLVGGPLAYLAGEKLGGIVLIQTTPALVALAVGWGLVMPALAVAAGRYNGFAQRSLPDFIHTDTAAGGISPRG